MNRYTRQPEHVSLAAGDLRHCHFGGALSGYVLPLPWPGSPFSDFLFGIGLDADCLALFIDFHAMRTMHRHKTTIMPNKGAAHLVTRPAIRIFTQPDLSGQHDADHLVQGLCPASSGLFRLHSLQHLTQKLAIEREENIWRPSFRKAWRDYRKRSGAGFD